MTNLIKPQQNGVNKSLLASIEKFTSRLNTPPNEEEVRINKHAGNSAYLPISFIEMTLDEMFFGDWTTENFTYQVIANEIVGSIDLVVTHPVTGREIKRVGAASVMIQMQRGSNVMDTSAKIKNTLVKDFPHLKASCLSNAAKSLGKLFGRDLNRLLDDQYSPMVMPVMAAEAKTINKELDSCKTTKELEGYFLENQQRILENTDAVNAYKKKKAEIQKKKK